MVSQNQKPNSFLKNSIYHAILKKKKGEEMTQNYSMFSAVFRIKLPKCNLNNKRKMLKINKSSVTF